MIASSSADFTSLFAGIGVGSIYAIVALAFALVIAVSGIFNFALESILMGGAVFGYEMMQSFAIPFGVTLVIVICFGLILGAASELLILTPFRRRRDLRDIGALSAVAAIGVSVVADTIVAAFFGSTPRTLAPFVSGTFLSIGGVGIQLIDWVLLGVAVAVAIVFEIVMLKTTFGIVVRSQREDSELASALGVAVPRVDRIIFASAGALAALSGFLISPIVFVYPTVGQQTVIPVFAALVIGGLYSFRGALIGGLLMGIAQEMLPLFINVSAVQPLIFLSIVVLLVVRPEGLISLGKRRVV